MDTKQLRAKGAFIATDMEPVEVSWTHADPESGEEMTDTFTVFVRRLSAGWLDRVFARTRVGGPGISRTAALISEGIGFGEGGAERLTYEEAFQLDFDLANELANAFNKVNTGGAVKKSLPPTSSGTN